MSTEPTPLEAVVQRDRIVILTGLAAVTALAWAYLFFLVSRMQSAGAMDMASEMAMPQSHSWGTVEVLLLFFMWLVMMIAMMLPSVAPMILIFARMDRQRGGTRVPGAAAILVLGYLLVWAGFSALASVAQWQLHNAALVSSMMVSTSSTLGGILLLSAGVFQFTPLKRGCLVRCRSPISFLISEWRDGRWGTLVMGMKHGVYCAGCCAVLMTLLFVAGVMNLLWVATIAAFILVEKLAPKGERLGQIAGAGLILAGIALMFNG